MKKIIIIIFLLCSIVGISQTNQMFIKYKVDNSFAFVDSSTFNADSMITYNSPYMVLTYGDTLKDYVFVRNYVKGIVTTRGFETLKSNDQELVASWCLSDVVTIVTYYMSTGISQSDAIQLYTLSRADQVLKSGECYSIRLDNKYTIATLLTFLGEAQGLTFLDAIRNFKEDLRTVALLGTNYDGDRDGIMDYIESTSGYVDGGLKTYTMSPETIAIYGSDEAAREALVQILHNTIIVNSYK